jgi:hypothetical protein
MSRGVLYAAIVAQGLPFLAALPRWRANPAPRQWTAFWGLTLVASDMISGAVTKFRGNNVLVLYLYIPPTLALILWVLSLWQEQRLWRTVYRIATALGLTLLPLLLLAPRPGGLIDDLGIPTLRLIGLAVALHLLVSRSARAVEPVAEKDWFWISLGVAIYFAGSVALQPFVAYARKSQPELLLPGYLIKAAVDIVAFLLITVGMLCTTPPTRHGGSS